ncbi:MAG: YfhO family protein [Methylocella sp.]
MVILADTYYPGWRLTIDGKPAPILRANRMMRGAAVRAGVHRLVYTYEPSSFRIGLIVSLAGAIVLLALVWSPASVRSRMRSAATSEQD